MKTVLGGTKRANVVETEGDQAFRGHLARYLAVDNGEIVEMFLAASIIRRGRCSAWPLVAIPVHSACKT
jgi:hypothetical protein